MVAIVAAVGLKQLLKRHRATVRQTIMQRFYAFTPAELLQGLRQLGICEGDSVLVHSSFDRFEGFLGKPTDVNAALKAAVGPSGNVLMPALPFSGSAVEYALKSPFFDVRRTPSRSGLLTELFRRQAGVLRSVHPTHSVAVAGADADYFIAEHYLSKTPCGRESPYSRLLDRDGKVLLLGTGIRPLTFYHFVEEEIESLLPFPVFTEETFALRSVDTGGNEFVTHTRLFNPYYSCRREMAKIIPHLKGADLWRERRIGSVTAIALRAADVLTISRDLARKGIFFYEQ